MSLLRLLTTGKTLVGLKKLEQRYQLPGGKALPQFGGKQNPFRATAFPEKAESASPEDPQVVAGANSGEMGSVQVRPELESATRDTLPKAEISHGAILCPGGTEKRSPLRALLLWGRAKKRKPANAMSARPLVQAELSLDSVKVMRNDLSESDFEIIPAGRVQRDATAAQRRDEQPAVAGNGISCIPELSQP